MGGRVRLPATRLRAGCADRLHASRIRQELPAEWMKTNEEGIPMCLFTERTEADPWLVKMPAYASRAQVKRLQGEIE